MAIISADEYAHSQEVRDAEAKAKAYRDSQSSAINIPSTGTIGPTGNANPYTHNPAPPSEADWTDVNTPNRPTYTFDPNNISGPTRPPHNPDPATSADIGPNPIGGISQVTRQPVQPPALAVNPDLIQQQKTAQINGQIAQQVQAFQQQLAQMQQANQLGVNQNNAYLKEQTDKYNQQKPADEQQIINLANRRGGFYSGGLDYQLAQNTKAYGERQQGLERDIGARNADIWSRNSQLAQQAAEKISMLQSQAPDMIQKAVQDEIDRQRGYAVQEAGLTGNFNGQRTVAGQQLDSQQQNVTFNQGLAIRNQQLNELKTAWDMSENNPQVQGQILSNQINKLKLETLPQETKLQLDALNADLETKKIGTTTAKYQMEQLMDPNSPINRKQDLDLQIKQMEVQYLPQEQKLKLAELQKRIAEIGKSPYRSPQQVEMDQIKLDTAREELTQLKSGGKPKQGDFTKYVNELNGRFSTKDANGDIVNLPPYQQRQTIIGLGLDDQTTIQLLNLYGLPIQAPTSNSGGR